MRPYLATFFRGKWIYMLVLAVMFSGTILGVWRLAHSQYQVTSNIWIGNPPLQNVLGQNSAYQQETPAQQEVDMLSQLIQTDDFMTSVAKGTSLSKQLTGVPDHDRAILTKLRQDISYEVVGSNTISIQFTGPNPILCQQVVQNTVKNLGNWMLQSQLQQSSTQMQYYKRQTTIYKAQMDNARQQINQFVGRFGAPKEGTAQYLQLQQLWGNYESAQGLYNTAQGNLNQVSIVDNLSRHNQSTDFRVLDQAKVPQKPYMSLKKVLMYLMMGVGASLGLVIVVVLMLTWMDKTIRTVDDISRISDVPVLAVIPNLELKEKGWRKGKRKRAAVRAVDMAVAEYK